MMYVNDKSRYTSSYEMFEYTDCDISLVENYPCNNRKELEKREGEVIKANFPVCVNQRIEGQTKKESDKQYYEKHKDAIAAHKKQYYDENKEAILAQRKKYAEANKETIAAKAAEKVKCSECGSTMSRSSMSKHKKKHCPITRVQ
jgi:hypothetical protein